MEASRGSTMLSVAVAAAALLMLVPSPLGAMAPLSTGSGHCTTYCGNIGIPYPFGVEPGCYLNGFNLTCDQSAYLPKLFLGDGTVEVLEISIPNATVRINSARIDYYWTHEEGANGTWSAGGLGYSSGPYFLLGNQNRLQAFGCNVLGILLEGKYGTVAGSCATFCPHFLSGQEDSYYSNCSGYECCKADIFVDRPSYRFQLHPIIDDTSNGISCAFIVDANYSVPMMEYHGTENCNFLPNVVPAVLGWAINSNSSTCENNGSSSSCLSGHSFCQVTSYENGFSCQCSNGYQGNPYISDGCYDIDECSQPEAHSCYGICMNTPGTFHCQCGNGAYGDPWRQGGCVTKKYSFTGLTIGLVVSSGSVLFLLAFSTPFITRKIKVRRANKLKERFFKQNHGLLLQHLISQKTDFGERMIIPLWELEKATNHFDRTRQVGGGGHGIVYKGILDLQVVAVKKSKIVVQREIDDFINEVAILSQINHRNVVKLIGCCLEAEVPLLVYEFITNGTLDHSLHAEGLMSLPWDDRVRIALEVARALSYLHSAASMPIYHRDIKSSNILLDENLTAKVSDFGASRYIPIDQTGVNTAVQGTIGYLDPMYYYTGRLTDKSDVFSFGVLLVELLTKKKPCFYRSDNGIGLVSLFSSLLEEGKLNEIMDPQVMEDDHGEGQEVAALAAMCTKLKGEERPTMREVEMTLQNLRGTQRHAPRDTASRRFNEDQTVADKISTNAANKEASRQYSMEQENMLSASYPR